VSVHRTLALDRVTLGDPQFKKNLVVPKIVRRVKHEEFIFPFFFQTECHISLEDHVHEIRYLSVLEDELVGHKYAALEFSNKIVDKLSPAEEVFRLVLKQVRKVF
jgi:hypothetical protein